MQQHSFYQPNDEDWVSFQVTAGAGYVVQTSSVQRLADTTLTVSMICGDPPIFTNDNAFGQGARISWTAQTTGMVFVNVTNHQPEVFGQDTGYDLSVR